MRSFSASSTATSSLSVKASKTGSPGRSPDHLEGGGPHSPFLLLYLLMTSAVVIDADFPTVSLTVCLQCAQDSDALPGELCERASAE